jgi:hypothetical protein
MMCGFIGATIVNAGLDGVLGFAPQENGPKWMLARPALISRFQTLLAKWAIAAVLTGVLTAIVLLVAAGILGMDAPDPLSTTRPTSTAPRGRPNRRSPRARST